MRRPLELRTAGVCVDRARGRAAQTPVQSLPGQRRRGGAHGLTGLGRPPTDAAGGGGSRKASPLGAPAPALPTEAPLSTYKCPGAGGPSRALAGSCTRHVHGVPLTREAMGWALARCSLSPSILRPLASSLPPAGDCEQRRKPWDRGPRSPHSTAAGMHCAHPSPRERTCRPSPDLLHQKPRGDDSPALPSPPGT